MTSALELRDVVVRIGGRAVLDRMRLRLDAGELAVLIGANGAGKTTALRTLLGLQAADAGAVVVEGEPIAALSGPQRAARLAWLPQRPHFFEPLPAVECVAAARYRFDEPREASRFAAEQALAQIDAAHLATRPVTRLSGGEQQKISFAAMLAQEAPTLLLDEPASHLDPAQQIEIYRRIGDLWQQGRTILCVSHDINLLRFLEGGRPIRIVGIRDGRAAFDTRLDDETLPRRLGELFGVEIIRLAHDGRAIFLPVEPRTPASGAAEPA